MRDELSSKEYVIDANQCGSILLLRKNETTRGKWLISRPVNRTKTDNLKALLLMTTLTITLL